MEEKIIPETNLNEEKEQKRRKREFFVDEKIKADDVLYQKRQLTTRGDLKRIQKAGYRHEGKKVVTDDVKKLKSLTVLPEEIDKQDVINYYVEPIRIEYYVPKDSKFKTEIRYLFIPLIDPPFDERYPILNEYIEKNLYFDVINIINEYPEHTSIILDSYKESLSIHERISTLLSESRKNPEHFKTIFYLNETLLKLEPTLAYLEVLGDYVSWDLNWLIRKLNKLKISFSAEDDTITYLIKRRNIYWEENNLPFDERFEILAALFYDQAYPNRGLSIEDKDYFYNIFDKK